MKTANDQSGFSVIGLVIILLIIGVFLLLGLNNSTTSWRKSFINQGKYYQNFNKAYSAIEWAKTLSWKTPSEKWQCKTQSKHQLKVCIKQSNLTKQKFVLIKGEGDDLKLYHLATYTSDGKLTFKKGHWLDYCPEKLSSDCE
ncbi:DUF2509 family protein [Orbaceae bacterium ac157xtp]